MYLLTDANDLESIEEMSNYDKANVVKGLLVDAVEILESMNLSPNAEAYFIDHLKIMSNRDHGFLDSSMTIDDIIDSVDPDKEPEEED